MTISGKLQEVIAKYDTTLKKVILTYPKPDDLRNTIFKRTLSVLNSAMISNVVWDNYLTHGEFWDKHLAVNMTDNDIKIHLTELNIFYKMAFFHSNFSILESTFRIFVKSIDPTACNNGTTEFKNIYAYLLRELSLQEYEPFLDLFRNVRNVIHNNGYYFHKSNDNQVIVYKNETYSFEIGKSPDFVRYSFIIDLIKNDLHDLYTKIIAHQKISSKTLIHDFAMRL